ncbi:type II toxin-antitoxin system RelE family toxin [Streptomyces avidinii]
MKTARFGFAAHPDALADLRGVPNRIRDLALLELQHLVHGSERGAAMHRELAGCHKVYVDPETRWRLVIQFRDAPASSQNQREIYLLAVGERKDNAVYRTAARRLHRAAPTGTPARVNPLAQAARSRSMHPMNVRPTTRQEGPACAPTPAQSRVRTGHRTP